MSTSVTLGKHRFLHVEVRTVPRTQCFLWLRRGWEDLRSMPAASLAYGALICALGAVLLAMGSTHPYFIAAAVTGYLLVGPLMTTGLCELSRRRALRERRGFDESLSAVNRNPEGLFHFGAILAAIAVLWFLLSVLLLGTTLHLRAPSLAVAMWGGAGDFANLREVVAYFSSGAVFAVVVFVMSVVSVPLIIDRHASAGEAIRVSARAALHNAPAMILWAGLIAALTALGFLTALIGMIVVTPLLGHATWHAYRDLIG